ncbi:ferritin-like domain-containing protein [Stakelama sp. CBK3Z-3]|uniref:Ferritin-like domain-containing protein n=1 Tax=Stakelama flava TaxID=2860338 RepID=A0ABS6XJW0_9SPHN|nr:ferritin-like domain-containing protein [Stakelama flava]MBW4330477.1 ferritin-like domain-containing protein [Stakelama flava]
MNQHDLILEVLARREERRADRRKFIKIAGTTGAVAASASLLAACDDGPKGTIARPAPTPTPTPTAPALTDGDILNFALNLEYLEAQFYAYAATGSGLSQDILGGSGTQGEVTGGRQVNFTDPVVAAYAREIAADERAHVEYIRNAIGSTAVAQPAIDISSDPDGSFSSAARAAGLIGDGESFDPYANDENFLLGAFIFEDVGVTAYKGASPLITDKLVLEAAAGILAAEAYHAGLIRSTLYRKGIDMPTLITSTTSISDARDSLDGDSDLDQGIAMLDDASNIVPADDSAVAFSRSTGQVLNIAYLNQMAVSRGGFFPDGVNGTISLSADN